MYIFAVWATDIFKFYIYYILLIFYGLRLLKALCLVYLPNFPGPTFKSRLLTILDSRIKRRFLLGSTKTCSLAGSWKTSLASFNSIYFLKYKLHCLWKKCFFFISFDSVVSQNKVMWLDCLEKKVRCMHQTCQFGIKA